MHGPNTMSLVGLSALIRGLSAMSGFVVATTNQKKVKRHQQDLNQRGQSPRDSRTFYLIRVSRLNHSAIVPFRFELSGGAKEHIKAKRG